MASGLPSPKAPTLVTSAVLGGGLGQAALVLPPPCSPPVQSHGESQSVLTDRPDGWSGAGGLNPTMISREEVIAFGGIPDPMSEGRRVCARLQTQPAVDDIQQRCAMRVAKLQDAAISTGISVNISNSLLHFSNEEIINNANQLGVSLGATNSEISSSVNDLLDLEAERALETIRNLAAVKPMNDNEIDALGVSVLNNMCVDLAPSNHESEDDDMPIENAVVCSAEPGYEDRESGPSKPKRKWKRKIYPDSAVRRSARIRTTKKFHDE